MSSFRKSRLTIWQRVSLVAATAILPLMAVILFVIGTSINKDIAFGAHEKMGSVYLEPLDALLDLLPRYQKLAAYAASGDSASSTALPELSQQIGLRFGEVGGLTDRYRDNLLLSDKELEARKRDGAKPASLSAAWSEIAKLPPEKLADGVKIAELVSGVHTLLTHVGDTSNLILDPDLDSYYMMDMVLCALPQTQDRLGRMAQTVREWTASGEIGGKKIDMAVLAALLREADIDRVAADASTALNEDANFYGSSATLQARLPAALKAYETVNRALVAQLDEIVAGKAAPDGKALEASILKSLDEAKKLWLCGNEELASLLSTRIAALKHNRLISFAGVALAVALVVVVIWLIVRGLNRLLAGVIAELSANCQDIATAAEQISSANERLSRDTNTQAASLDETSATLSEIQSMTERNTENALKANELSSNARNAAEHGSSGMKEMSSAMSDIRTSSSEIAQIIKTIDEIAFQTNILALNAAVEAARAGEAGLGFAVVSEEVRSLAQRSAEAAKDTTGKIERALGKTRQGVELTEKVAKTLDEILSKSRQQDELAKEVALASKEQNEGIAQIGKAVNEMSTVMQHNAISTESSVTIAYSLNEQARNLRKSIQDLRSLVGAQAKLAGTGEQGAGGTVQGGAVAPLRGSQ